MKLPAANLGEGPEAARRLLDQSPLGAAEIARPALDALPYRDLVRALLAKQGFRLDFNRMSPDAALAMVSDQLLGPGAFVRERDLLAHDIAALAAFAGGLVGARPSVAIRTLFAPGDLVWHVDRLDGAAAFRLLWPIGRPAGMKVTTNANIDDRMFRAFMRREHPLLCRLDAQTHRTGAPLERLWAHRPAQVEAMIAGRFPFVRDPEQECEVTPGAASIHRVETPAHRGTFHRSSWENRHSPGLQIVITASDAA
jgi:hypothetical protein